MKRFDISIEILESATNDPLEEAQLFERWLDNGWRLVGTVISPTGEQKYYWERPKQS